MPWPLDIYCMVDEKEPFDKSTYIIGQVVITFSTMDMMLDWLLQCLLETDSKTRTSILLEMRFNDKVKLLGRLYLQTIRKRRNTFMHSLWSVDTSRDLARETITEGDLDVLLESISGAIKLLVKHTRKLNRGYVF